MSGGLTKGALENMLGKTAGMLTLPSTKDCMTSARDNSDHGKRGVFEGFESGLFLSPSRSHCLPCSGRHRPPAEGQP